MYQHILIPIDGSDLSQIGLTQGLALARALQARVTIMTVLEPFHIPSSEGVRLASVQQQFQRQARERAQGWLDAAAARAQQAGIPCDSHVHDEGQPYAAIVEYAAQAGCDLIAMCSHGRSGMAAMVLGSQTQKVLAKSKIPVLVYR
ncbi:universal stress protein [Bordetella sp. BOR01]|uniref:universal stress protein n=1 Tax=Bordetella sp. BOR01 TaxID=2854779 RepID=UPI001C49338F|nr:universal stress protein [Bordetella sp. BOR01]MBV7486087.1 universal stress protein [Bordetella sp. BOR01]